MGNFSEHLRRFTLSAIDEQALSGLSTGYCTHQVADRACEMTGSGQRCPSGEVARLGKVERRRVCGWYEHSDEQAAPAAEQRKPRSREQIRHMQDAGAGGLALPSDTAITRLIPARGGAAMRCCLSPTARFTMTADR